MERAIIHLNVADFAVAVERALDRRLENRPVIIAPAGAARAAVYDMSEEAYRAGVRKEMPLPAALRRCRDAEVLPPHPDRYAQAMNALLKEALPYSPLIEPGEKDGHLFMDVTGTRRLFGPPIDVAWRLQRRIRTGLSLAPIWSVAPNKLVAKVATRIVKPTGEYIVGAGEEAAFLSPLPLFLLPGIERRDLLQLRALNLTRPAEVAALSRAELAIPFGNRAELIYETVRGIDPSPVRLLAEKAPRIVINHTFGTDTHDPSLISGALYLLVETAGRELRRQRLATRRIGLFIDYTDGIQHVRSAAIRPASANDIPLFEAARSVLHAAWIRRVRVRHLRLVCDRLTFPPAQLPLFAADRAAEKKRSAVVTALDAVRDRFGIDALRVGRTLGLSP
jgi:DNA polymerase-4